jgi:hypothetical protein
MITSLFKHVSRFPYRLAAFAHFSFFVVTVPLIGVKGKGDRDNKKIVEYFLMPLVIRNRGELINAVHHQIPS